MNPTVSPSTCAFRLTVVEDLRKKAICSLEKVSRVKHSSSMQQSVSKSSKLACRMVIGKGRRPLRLDLKEDQFEIFV